MQLYETVNGEIKVRLLRDHQPNQAMLNEFQTAQFDCKMTKMELCGNRLHGYEVDEPACFLKVFLSLRNVTQMRSSSIRRISSSAMIKRNSRLKPKMNSVCPDSFLM